MLAAQDSGLAARGSGLRARGSGLGARGSGLGARGSGLGARGSGLGARGSGLGARGSGLGARGSGLGARGSGLGARGSGLRAQGSGLGARGSGLGARGSGLGARTMTQPRAQHKNRHLRPICKSWQSCWRPAMFVATVKGDSRGHLRPRPTTGLGPTPLPSARRGAGLGGRVNPTPPAASRQRAPDTRHRTAPSSGSFLNPREAVRKRLSTHTPTASTRQAARPPAHQPARPPAHQPARPRGLRPTSRGPASPPQP